MFEGFDNTGRVELTLEYNVVLLSEGEVVEIFWRFAVVLIVLDIGAVDDVSTIT
jgi:hypothetical protein